MTESVNENSSRFFFIRLGHGRVQAKRKQEGD